MTSIERGPRKTRDFTILDNSLLQDSTLSFGARGLGSYILSLPDGAQADIKTLAKRNPEGRQAIANYAAELEQAGYLVRTVSRGERGRLVTRVVMYEDRQEPAEKPSSLPLPWSKKPKTATSDEEVKPQVGPKTAPPDFGGPDSGRPNFGETGFKDLKDLSEKNQDQDLSLSPLDLNLTNRAGAVQTREINSDTETTDPPQTPQEPRTAIQGASPGTDPTLIVLGAYEAAAGRQLVNGTRTRFLNAARTFVDAGTPVRWLTDRAAEMPAHGWVDLAKHVERSTVPVSAPARSAPPQRAVCRECERPITNELASDGLCRDCRTAPETPAATCFFCENTERPGWRYDADEDLVECDHLDEYAAN